MSVPRYGKADDLRRGLEIAEGIAHPRALRDALHRLKLVSSDNAPHGVLSDCRVQPGGSLAGLESLCLASRSRFPFDHFNRIPVGIERISDHSA